MPTIISHAIVPIAAGVTLGPNRIPPALVLAGALAAMAPDADVLSFKIGIPYAADFGHRGASHSLLFAVLLAAACAALGSVFQVSRRRIFLFIFAAAASHGVLDMFTNGGRGVALLWPLSSARLFAPVRPIEVSPIGYSNVLSAHFAEVLLSEALWIWVPASLCVLLVRAMLGRGQSDRAQGRS